MVALLDADTIPHRTWLRELVAPLADPRVGAATGNRWYMPAEAGWAGLVRYLWNAAAVVQMYCYGIAWGGTLALKRACSANPTYWTAGARRSARTPCCGRRWLGKGCAWPSCRR